METTISKNLTVQNIIELLDVSNPTLVSERNGSDMLSRKLMVSRQATIKEIHQALQMSVNDNIKLMLCEILGWRNAKSSIPTLIKCLNDNSPLLRNEAANSLRKMCGDRVGKALFERLEIENDTSVRRTLVWCLGVVGYTPSVFLLLKLLNDFDEHTRAFAAQSLGRFGYEYHTQVIPSLENALRDVSSWVKEEAKNSIKSINVKLK